MELGFGQKLGGGLRLNLKGFCGAKLGSVIWASAGVNLDEKLKVLMGFGDWIYGFLCSDKN